MHVMVTGTPGTGKTTVSKLLCRQLKAMYVNERTFIQCHRLGRKNGTEWEVDPSVLAKALKKYLKIHSNAVLDGHLLCETPLKVDAVFVLSLVPSVLEKRLRKRKYSEVKILDNVWAEKQHYCFHKAVKTFGKEKVFCIENSQSLKAVAALIVKRLHRMGFGS